MHVSHQMLDVLSALWLQLEGDLLLVIISADVWLAGSKICALQLQWVS